MKNLTMLLAFLVAFSPAIATLPDVINYQGVLRDNNDDPADGSFDMIFRFFDASVGGNEILVDSHLAAGTGDVTVTGGLFNVGLGGGTVADGAAVFADDPYDEMTKMFRDFGAVFLQIEIDPPPAGGGFEMLSPRVQVVSAAYSLNADNLGGVAPSGYLDTSFKAQTKTGTLAVLGNVGIRTANPVVNGLHIDTSSIPGGEGLPALTAGTGLLVQANNGGNWGHISLLTSVTGNGRLNFGDADNDDQGYIGYSNPVDALYLAANGSERMRIDSSGTVGIKTATPQGSGLHIDASTIPGGEGLPAITAGTGLLVQANNGGNWGHISLLASRTGDGRLNFGDADNDGQGYIAYSNPIDALYLAANGSERMRINSIGNVGIGTTAPAHKLDVNGSGRFAGFLSKAGGGFQIDHPLDPANMYLNHSFVESPDMMNIYNGNVTTDETGRAVITFPEWFAAVNRQFRYQLTVIGTVAQAIVEEEIRDGRFTIRTDQPEVRVSWQVTGIRHDPWAELNRPEVEQLKTNHERGKFLHPGLYGRPPEFSVAHAATPAASEAASNGAASAGHAAAAEAPESSEAVRSDERPNCSLPMDEAGNVYARSFRPSASGLANLVQVLGPVTAGDVVVIDPDRAGVMSRGRVAGDTAVFGIVAAAPGVVLGAEPPEREKPEFGETSDVPPADGIAPVDVPVAVSGVVLCKVDAEYGSIRPGDLLTTSPTAGHAMRAADPRPGTILGKALEPLDHDTGLIRVLVMLR